jgi:hypothetical protein
LQEWLVSSHSSKVDIIPDENRITRKDVLENGCLRGNRRRDDTTCFEIY